MADKNIFGGTQGTPNDNTEIAMGTLTSFFVIKLSNFRKLFSSLWLNGVECLKVTLSGIIMNSNTVQIGDGVDIDDKELVFQRGLTTGIYTDFRAINTGGFFKIQYRSTSTGDAWRDAYVVNPDGELVSYHNGNEKLKTVAGGVQVTGAYLPFTGCHIAKSDEDLKIGELVQIKSVGWINEKQPDWEASYCNGSKKGIYGIVYGVGEDTYLIAATGDGFVKVDCACECGDILIPSEIKGLATVYKGEFMPLNYVGFAGEDSEEGGKIAWTKE